MTPKTITREESDRIRREGKEHLVVVEGKYALHMVRDEHGITYIVDEACHPEAPRMTRKAIRGDPK